MDWLLLFVVTNKQTPSETWIRSGESLGIAFSLSASLFMYWLPSKYDSPDSDILFFGRGKRNFFESTSQFTGWRDTVGLRWKAPVLYSSASPPPLYSSTQCPGLAGERGEVLTHQVGWIPKYGHPHLWHIVLARVCPGYWQWFTRMSWIIYSLHVFIRWLELVTKNWEWLLI